VHPVIEALISQLLRKGVLDSFDIQAMSVELDSEGKRDDANTLRAVFVDTVAQTQSEWQRQRFYAISGGKE
jgi:hypothetical protein